MTLSPRTIARSIFRWAWLSCISSAFRRTRFMWGSNPSRIPRYPRPPFSSTITFELIRWLRRESGLIIGPRPTHGGDLLKGCRVRRKNAPRSSSPHEVRSPEGFSAVSFGSGWRRSARSFSIFAIWSNPDRSISSKRSRSICPLWKSPSNRANKFFCSASAFSRFAISVCSWSTRLSIVGADGVIAAGSGEIGFSGAALVDCRTDGETLLGICWIALTGGDGTPRGSETRGGPNGGWVAGVCDVPGRTRGTDLRPRAFPVRRKEGKCRGPRRAGRRQHGDPYRTSTGFLGHSRTPRLAPRGQLREVTGYRRSGAQPKTGTRPGTPRRRQSAYAPTDRRAPRRLCCHRR